MLNEWAEAQRNQNLVNRMIENINMGHYHNALSLIGVIVHEPGNTWQHLQPIQVHSWVSPNTKDTLKLFNYFSGANINFTRLSENPAIGFPAFTDMSSFQREQLNEYVMYNRPVPQTYHPSLEH